MQWIDKRIPVDENLLKFDEVEGVLCNVRMTTMFSSLWSQRHWFALRKIQGVCYNLDSKLPAPQVVRGHGQRVGVDARLMLVFVCYASHLKKRPSAANSCRNL